MEGVTNTTITLSSKTYVILNGYGFREVEATDEAGGTLPSHFGENDEFAIRSGDTIIAKFNRVPFALLIGKLGEYVVVRNALNYYRTSATFVPRIAVTAANRVMLNIADFNSNDLYVGNKGGKVWFYNYVASTETLTSFGVFYIGFHFWEDRPTIEVAAAKIASCTPAGIRFKDRFNAPNQLESYLAGILPKQTDLSRVSFSTPGPYYHMAFTFEDVLEINDPSRELVKVVNTMKNSLSVTNVDASEVPSTNIAAVIGEQKSGTEIIIESAVNSPAPVFISNMPYPTIPTRFSSMLPAQKKLAVTWKGMTYYPFIYYERVMLWGRKGDQWLNTHQREFKGWQFLGMSIREKIG